MAKAQTPEVLNLKKLIEPPDDTDIGLLHSSIHTGYGVWHMTAKPNRKTGVAGKKFI